MLSHPTRTSRSFEQQVQHSRRTKPSMVQRLCCHLCPSSFSVSRACGSLGRNKWRRGGSSRGRCCREVQFKVWRGENEVYRCQQVREFAMVLQTADYQRQLSGIGVRCERSNREHYCDVGLSKSQSAEVSQRSYCRSRELAESVKISISGPGPNTARHAFADRNFVVSQSEHTVKPLITHAMPICGRPGYAYD